MLASPSSHALASNRDTSRAAAGQIGSVLSPLTICEVTGSLLTADQVADLLGVPKTWVYEQSRSNRIPTVTLGRYRRYRREAVEAWVEQLETPARGARAYAGSAH